MLQRRRELAKTHLGTPYVLRDSISGHEAVVAKHANGTFVSIQVHARGMTIEMNASNAGPPDDVEVRLAAATAKVIETLAIGPEAAPRQ